MARNSDKKRIIRKGVFMARNLDKKRIIWWLGLLSVIAILGGYCITIGFRGMPPTEGWYTWYSELINQGKMVYKDFSYLFYPFYIQFIALFCKVFGYSIFTLRILGLIVFCGIGIASYLLFSRLTSAIGATFAAIATTMFLQSEVVQLFYDYIRFMDLFAYLSIYFLVCYMQQIKTRIETERVSKSILFAAVFATLACMTKQSTGTLLIVYTIILLLFVSLVFKDYLDAKKIICDAIGYVSVVILLFGGMFVWLYCNGALGDFFINATGSALAAKGGLVTVLFQWILDTLPAMIKQFPVVIIYLIMIIAIWSMVSFKIKNCNHYLSIELLARKDNSNMCINYSKKKDKDLELILGGSLLLGGIIVVCRKSIFMSNLIVHAFSSNMATFGFVLCSLCFFVLALHFLVCFIRKWKTSDDGNVQFEIKLLPWFALLGSIFAIGYGGGISGGLCESQTALTVGFSIILLSKALENKKFRTIGIIVLILMSSLFSSACASRKYLNIYSWWGLTEGTIWDAQYVVDHPVLEGIKMNINEYEMYSGVIDRIGIDTNESDTIFCFPHIPILYSLTDRDSITYTQVQWFDMSNIRDIKLDIEKMEKNAPKAIIYCEMPEYVYESHENRFNHSEKSQTRVMSEFLMDFVARNKYTLVDEYNICEGYTIKVYLDY